MKSTNITKNFAILAPVPQEHLEDGLDCAIKVAFGSTAGSVFAEADNLRQAANAKVRVFIYESHSERPTRPPKVSWTGLYIGQVQAVGKNKVHPQGDLYRPRRAFLTDKPGAWLIYWEVENLKPLSDLDRFLISALCGLADPGSRRPKPNYSSNFAPRGPLLIEYPSQAVWREKG